MYETLMKREEQLNENRYNDTRLNRGIEYVDNYAQSDFANTYINNYLPAVPYQNDAYTSCESDNINMNVNEYDMYAMNQQANMYAQAPIYQPQNIYDYQQNAYNNVSAQAQTRPTQYYQQQPVYRNMFVPQQNQEETITSYRAPAKAKGKKNKMVYACIAVYFMIIAVCAALILVNVFAGNTSVVASSSAAAIAEEANVAYAVNQTGATVNIAKTEKVIDYSYDTTTNWFDKLCDKIGSKLG